MFFFFGTLMDADVLARVIGRPVTADELAVAELDGYRRVRARRASYPVLVPSIHSRVEGRLMAPRDAFEEARIAWFEEGEYAEHRRSVRRRDGSLVHARLFFGLPALGTTADEWDPTTWARQDKAAFLERCDRWLDECPIRPSSGQACGRPHDGSSSR